MLEKVNMSHPDKLADRIAGAIVDKAYILEENPKIAVEVLIGHGLCTVIAETSVWVGKYTVEKIVNRICPEIKRIEYIEVPQDPILAENQSGGIRCGDNGIFKGAPITKEQRKLTDAVQALYSKYPYDGKYLTDGGDVIACQSNADSLELKRYCRIFLEALDDMSLVVNPLGDWTGGTGVDTGATNRKLGSDMGDGVTGGGLHGKDLSKADVSVNIYCFLEAQKKGRIIEASCSIGDKCVNVDGKRVPFREIVEVARGYIRSIGGFERFAEWGLIR